MKITVLIPTYNRQADLRRCLQALTTQTRLPDQVLLIVRKDDTSTLELVSEWNECLPLDIKHPEMPGQVNALNAGLSAAHGDIVAITDDDAAPRQDWLLRIEQHLCSNPRVGGVGGRDWVHHESLVIDDGASEVGRIMWYGRLVGNHHLGIGPTREVDFLKGVNMSYRRSAIDDSCFDHRLRGRGAQVSNDMAFSLAVKRKGWKLLYDPDVAVDHYPAPRFDIDQRGEFQPKAVEDAGFNQYWALAIGMPRGLARHIACTFQTMVGSRAQPGYLHVMIGLSRLDRTVWKRWRAAHRGRQAALSMVRQLNAHR